MPSCCQKSLLGLSIAFCVISFVAIFVGFTGMYAVDPEEAHPMNNATAAYNVLGGVASAISVKPFADCEKVFKFIAKDKLKDKDGKEVGANPAYTVNEVTRYAVRDRCVMQQAPVKYLSYFTALLLAATIILISYAAYSSEQKLLYGAVYMIAFVTALLMLMVVDVASVSAEPLGTLDSCAKDATVLQAKGFQCIQNKANGYPDESVAIGWIAYVGVAYAGCGIGCISLWLMLAYVIGFLGTSDKSEAPAGAGAGAAAEPSSPAPAPAADPAAAPQPSSK